MASSNLTKSIYSNRAYFNRAEILNLKADNLKNHNSNNNNLNNEPSLVFYTLTSTGPMKLNFINKTNQYINYNLYTPEMNFSGLYQAS